MPRPHRPSVLPARPAAASSRPVRHRASSRAAIMPSPPLLPRPHSTVTRCACGNCSARKRRHGRCRRPHQINRRHPEPLRRRAVAGLHLGCRKNLHRFHTSRCQNSILRLKCNHARRAVSAQAHAQQSCRWRNGALQRPEIGRNDLPGTPASTLLGSAKLGWLKALNICTSKRSELCSQRGNLRDR